MTEIDYHNGEEYTDEEFDDLGPTPDEIIAMAARGKAILDAKVIELRPRLAAATEVEEAAMLAHDELRSLPSADIVDIMTFMVKRHYDNDGPNLLERVRAAKLDAESSTDAPGEDGLPPQLEPGERPGAMLDAIREEIEERQRQEVNAALDAMTLKHDEAPASKVSPPRKFTRFTAANHSLQLNGMWAVKGVFPAHGLNMFVGAPSAAKTFLVLDIFLHIAMGWPWRGRKALAHAREKGAGQRYLIQHSAGSGKSNSIAWLAHQLIAVRNQGKTLFDSVIVVTDRRILDDQIQTNIKQFMQVGATVGHAEHSGDLRRYIEGGMKIIISTVQKFPFILDEIGAEGGKTFAIVIDEAHSSQGGKTSSAMSQALGGQEDEEGEDAEDAVNAALAARMAARKMLTNASYFAFTATPKNKTLEMFGEPMPADAEGKIQHRPFHSYTMKQAVEEGFILDVLKYYTPVDSFYKLVKKTEDDPEFDTKKARKKLRRYVEGHDHAIRLKAEIMVDHFHEQVIAAGKIGGQARAMVVTGGIERAIQYFHAIIAYLIERKSPYKAIVAFSGEHEYGGVKVTEASLNGFPSNDIARMIQTDPYRFLICADKFQTGYDEPLLHTMYVDKPLSGIKAVQTLSRLNRAHPQKHDCFVLDFQNNSEAITFAFQDYYRTTLLADETDPNKLHDLKRMLDEAQVYSPEQVDQIVELFLGGAERDKLDPILDACVAVYVSQLDEDGQVGFKGKAKVFSRSYAFLSSIIPYGNADWEKLSIFLDLLTPKLPAPKEEDLASGILEAIDMDSYRVEKKAAMKIALADKDAQIETAPMDAKGHKPDPELDRLSSILKSFNDQFATLFADTDRVARRIREDIAPKVAADAAYQNAKENTPHTARMAHDQALSRVMQHLLKDDTAVYKQFVENESFKRFIGDMVFEMTRQGPSSQP